MTSRSSSRRECARPAHRTNPISSAATSIRTACMSIENAQGRCSQHGVFEARDATKRDYSNVGVLFANPPYGERLLDLQQAESCTPTSAERP
ncbi:MAG: hypothetical protein ACLUI6_10150 [Butyricicoccus sp.]